MRTTLKKFTAIVGCVLAVVAALCIASCGDGRGSFAPEGGFSADASSDASENNGGSQSQIVKQLTAAEWSDARNYEFWRGLFEKDIKVEEKEELKKEPEENEGEEQTTRNGIFYEYARAPRGLDTSEMNVVNVSSGGSPVAGARVTLYDGDEAVYSAVTDSEGKAYVFGKGTRIAAASGEFVASAALSDGTANVELANSAACKDELEIMLVVDTTGSMSDELTFLCDELAGVVTRISSALDCNIRLAMLFYRDEGDDYVTRKFDFTDVTSAAGLNKVVENLKKQKADGGGDYPEAVDAALAEAVTAGWHEDSKTRLLFHVLDAPYHDKQENQTAFSGAVKAAAKKGIRIIPVAASGLDTLGQYIMRSAALMTGGTYAFLTDDSGIGNSHEIPAVGEYTVEYLSDLMVRIVKGYYTGTFEAPVSWKQSSSVA